jgi:hypothetical protein
MVAVVVADIPLLLDLLHCSALFLSFLMSFQNFFIPSMYTIRPSEKKSGVIMWRDFYDVACD